MNVIKTICAVLMFVSAGTLAEAQTRDTQVIWSVPEAIFLTLAAPSAGVEVATNAASEGRLHLRVRRQSFGNPVRVSLLARSNTAYQLMAWAQSVSTLIVHPVGALPFSGSDHLMPDALNVRFEPGSALWTRSCGIFEGRRLS
jgi:hypothetical protein